MIGKSPVLELRNVGVRLGGHDIVVQASARFEAGRFVALIGPNGAGKTTLLKAMAGLLPTSGDIALQSVDLRQIARLDRARRIAYLPQGHQVHWPMTARAVVALGRYPHGLQDDANASSEDCRAIEDAMARTDTAIFAQRQIMSLSGGERARVMLARVLAVGAPVILADEPTASLDPRHQISVMQGFREESRRGTLVIVVTHDIGLAARLADEVLLMDRGRILAQGPPGTVLSDECLAAVYGVKAIRQTVGGTSLITPWGLA